MNKLTPKTDRKWWQLLPTGVAAEGDSMGDIQKKGVNFSAISWLPIMVAFGLFCFTYNQWHVGLMMFMLMGMQLLVVMFNGIGNYRLSNIIYLLGVNFLVLAINLAFDFRFSTYFYFFPLFASVFFLYPWKTAKNTYVLTTMVMLIIHLNSYVFSFNGSSHKASVDASEWFTVFNFSCSFLLTLLFFWRFNVLKSMQKVELDRIILDYKAQQVLLEETIKERNVLLSEIHHRTKNNLAIISSMLQLQRHQVSDEKMKNILMDSSNRVHSMAKVHHKLYERSDFAQIDFKEYLTDLIEDLKFTIFPKDLFIDVQIDIDSFSITSDKAIPFSLIMNEVLTNSVKYAFTENGGKIVIKISRIAQQVLVMIHDNGKGFDLEVARKKASLGMTLIEALCEQLDGRFEFNTTNGTTFTMNFSLN